jgi:tetratricopeptide (TPR) repeat protein
MKITTQALIVLLALWSNSAFSAQSYYNPLEPKPLDEVLSHFDRIQPKLKNPKARVLAQAMEALEAGKTAKARGLATTVLGNPLFSDYAHWIIGLAFEADAELKDESGKLKPASTAARMAFQHFQAILSSIPYSPFFKQAPKKIGETALLWAYGTSPGKDAPHLFESAFERLSRSGDLSLVTADEVLSYAQACKKFPTDLCIPWLTHLTEHVNRNSEQYSSIVELYPRVEEHSKNPATSHGTQPYHAPDLDFAAYDDAMLSLAVGKWDECATKLQKFTDEFPKSAFRYRARYWLGIALQHGGKKDEANKIFTELKQDSPLSYYGVLASIAARAPIDSQITTDFPVAAERDVMLSAQETYNLRRAEIFLSENAKELAGIELKEIKPRPAHSSAFLTYLAGLCYRAQVFSPLYGALTELIQRGYPNISSKIGVEMIFPLLYTQPIKKFAEERSLDPALVLSLIKQESAFDSRANSSSGASGLMQLMYFTAAETVPGITREELLVPERNILTGTRYLAKLLARYQGNIVLSLAAYNAGPAPVDRWVKEGVKQNFGMLEFIESIPYKETREYVSAIVRNYIWYSRWYSDDLETQSPKSLAFFWKPYGGLNPDVGGPDFAPETLTSRPAKKPEPSRSPSPTPSQSPSPSPSFSLEPEPSPSPSVLPSPIVSPASEPVVEISPSNSSSKAESTRSGISPTSSMKH